MKPFSPSLIIESPGRINLIGEHTDYNLGYVLPTAIDKRITFKFRSNDTAAHCTVLSAGRDQSLSIDLQKIVPSDIEWENYILGVLHEIGKRSGGLRGFDCVIESNLPVGSGVSSSAALECGLAYGLNELFNLGLSREDIVSLSRDAEHSFVGTQCGIMDQFASVMSRKGHVILLDCRTLEHSYIPLKTDPYKLLLLNTNVSHNLASSEYNTRKRECEEGVAIIQKLYPGVQSLRDATLHMLETVRERLRPVVYKRCRFIIEENERVLAVADALQNQDIPRVGTLLYEGHSGLSHLYEISCPESDFLVDYTRDIQAVLGARQMGGGFGGCTINLVHETAVESFTKDIAKAYADAFPIHLTHFEAEPSEGTFISYPQQTHME